MSTELCTASHVLASEDVGPSITSSVSWESLNSLRSVDHGLLAAATREQFLRMQKSCSVFLPEHLEHSFPIALCQWKGGVVGSVPLNAIMPPATIASTLSRMANLSSGNESLLHRSNDMNILVPDAAWTDALDWFRTHGFSAPLALDIAPAYRNHVDAFVYLVPPDVEMQDVPVSSPLSSNSDLIDDNHIEGNGITSEVKSVEGKPKVRYTPSPSTKLAE